MSYYVLLLVTFPCNENDEVAALAKDHLVRKGLDPECKKVERTNQNDGQWEAELFLRDLSKRSGLNSGHNGGVSSWGRIGNYVREAEFVAELLPFFSDLLGLGPAGEIDGGPMSHHHVLVFSEYEDAGCSSVHDIFRPEEATNLQVDKKQLPVGWGI